MSAILTLRGDSHAQKTTCLFIAKVSIPIALNAEKSFFRDKLPSIVKNIAQGFEDGNAEEAAKNEAATYSLNAANYALDDGCLKFY